jgi:hypothetical protein
MATVPPHPASSLPFSPLAGWGDILIVLLVLVAVALAFLALLWAGSTTHEREDWQGWLAARSAGRRREPAEPSDGSECPCPEVVAEAAPGDTCGGCPAALSFRGV